MSIHITHEELARAGLTASENGEVVQIDPNERPNLGWSEDQLGVYAVKKLDLYSALTKKPTPVYFWAGCALWFLRERLKPRGLFLSRLAELKIAKSTAYEALALYEGAGDEANVMDLPITQALAKWAPPKVRKPIARRTRKYEPEIEVEDNDGASESAEASGPFPGANRPSGIQIVGSACDLPVPSVAPTMAISPEEEGPDYLLPANAIPKEGTTAFQPLVPDPAKVLTTVHHLLRALLDAGLTQDEGLRRQVDEIEQVLSNIKDRVSV
jgi:hypothetical protein